MHVPVLLREVLEALRPERGGVYVDATLGLGGHAEAILAAGEGVRLVGIDRDPEARPRVGTPPAIRRSLRRGGGAPRGARSPPRPAGPPRSGRGPGRPRRLLDAARQGRAGVLFHEGRTSRHAHGPVGPDGSRPRGRADRRRAGEDLLRIRRGARSRAVARAIVQTRETAPIRTTGELRTLVAKAIGGRREEGRDPATRVFQALRIATNRELVELGRFLDDAIARLSLGARLAVLSYHSLEDRIVKDTFRDRSARRQPPAVLPGLRLLPSPGSRPRHEEAGPAVARRGVRQPARQVGADARGGTGRTRASEVRLRRRVHRPPPRR